METISVPTTFALLAARLVLATVLGAAVGANREMQLKPAGLRTHALAALGAALATLLGLLLTRADGSGDLTATSRVLQGILAGIGFIGGGVILRRDDLKGVHGLTTAASIWVVATIGAAAGAGLWRSAITSVVLALLVLTVGGPIDRALHRLRGKSPDVE